MKKSFITLFIIYLFSSYTSYAISVTGITKKLSGIVTDKKTGEKIAGASIYFPDLQTGSTSDANGNYTINNLPKSKALLQVSFIG